MTATATKQTVTFRNILFATDFSAASNAAIPYVAGLAKDFDAKLYALHVHEPANYALPPEAWQVEQCTHEMESQFLRDLVKHDFAGVTPQILEGEGGIQRAVSATTIAHDIDLMVVGTRGRTGLGKALLGSTAEELLRHATCPVLTVGPSVRSENGASRKVKRIVYASDFGVASVAAAPVALALAEHYGAHLTVLHVAKQLRGADDFDSATYEDSYDRQLRSLIPKETSQRLQPDYVVAEGAPAEKILEVAKRVNADLIVLGARRSKGFPGAATHLSSSVVHQVVAEAGCPVLTYPEPKLA